MSELQKIKLNTDGEVRMSKAGKPYGRLWGSYQGKKNADGTWDNRTVTVMFFRDSPEFKINAATQFKRGDVVGVHGTLKGTEMREDKRNGEMREELTFSGDSAALWGAAAGGSSHANSGVICTTCNGSGYLAPSAAFEDHGFHEEQEIPF